MHPARESFGADRKARATRIPAPWPDQKSEQRGVHGYFNRRLEGNSPVLIYQVENLEESAAALQARGWVAESGPFEIPNGPCFRFHDPAGTRLAIYEDQRPGVNQKFAGRFDTE